MKKRVALYLLIIVLSLIIPNVSAIYGDSLYSGKVKDGKTIDIEGMLFSFTIEPVKSKVYVGIGSSGTIVQSGECRTKDSLNICIKNISFSYKNYTTFKDVYTADVEIVQIKARIETSHKIDKNNILIDEETTVELGIQNTADTNAEDVIATINVPSSLIVTETEGCKNIYGNVVLSGSITPKETKICTYKLRGLKGSNFELILGITYFDGIKAVNITSSTIKGEVYNYSLKISAKLNESKFDINERFNLTVNIENINKEYELDVTVFNIKLPYSILLIKRPKEFAGSNNLLSWSGHLAPKENKSFIIGLEGQETGNHSIAIESSYKISKFLRNEKSAYNIEIYCNCPYIQHQFFPEAFAPNQTIRLKASLVNPSQSQEFNNIKISYATSIPKMLDFSTVYQKIKPLESISIFDYYIKALDTHHLNVTVNYESESQNFVINGNIPISSYIDKIQEKPIKTVVEKEDVIEEKQPEKEEKGEDIGNRGTPIEVEVSKPPLTKYLTFSLIVVIIAMVAVLLIILYVFKKRSILKVSKTEKRKQKRKKIEEPHKEKKKKFSLKELLAKITKKSKPKDKDNKKVEKESKKRGDSGKEDEYNKLEEEINKLGNIFEEEKQAKERGFFGRILNKIKNKK